MRKDRKVDKKIEARCKLKIRKNEHERHKRDTRLSFVSYHKRILKYRQFLTNEFQCSSFTTFRVTHTQSSKIQCTGIKTENMRESINAKGKRGE